MELPDIQKIAVILMKPASPKDGPPLPASWDLYWPGFLKRGIERLLTEGPSGPWKTIKERGLKEELKREFEIVTGRKL